MQLSKSELRSEFNSRAALAVRHWKTRCIPRIESGLLLYISVLIARPFVLYIFLQAYWRILHKVYPLAAWMTIGSDDRIAATYRCASDLYKAVMDMILVCVYILSLLALHELRDSSCGSASICMAAGFALYRLGDICITVAFISLDPHYVIQHTARAVANTLWHYAEIAVSFSVLYMALVFFDRNAIVSNSGHGLDGNPVAPIYFSVVTIVTLGYGDFTPSTNNSAGMFLVMLELSLGTFMLLVVLQKSVSMAIKNRIVCSVLSAGSDVGAA